MRDDTNNLNNHVPHRADESDFAHDRLPVHGQTPMGQSRQAFSDRGFIENNINEDVFDAWVRQDRLPKLKTR